MITIFLAQTYKKTIKNKFKYKTIKAIIPNLACNLFKFLILD